MGKYAALEVNRLQSRTTGQMIAQAPFKAGFTCTGVDGASQNFAENGMLLTYDPATHTIVGDGKGSVIGLVHNSEIYYRDDARALSDYFIPADSYARLYILTLGDTFTTNAVAGGVEGAAVGATYGTGKGYLEASETGICKVVEKTTLPDGTPAIKFMVVNA